MMPEKRIWMKGGDGLGNGKGSRVVGEMCALPVVAQGRGQGRYVSWLLLT